MDLAGIMGFAALLTSGGPASVIAILLMIIAFLWYDRRRMLADLLRKDEKIDKIVDDYFRGNVTLAEALNSLKSVLFEI